MYNDWLFGNYYCGNNPKDGCHKNCKECIQKTADVCQCSECKKCLNCNKLMKVCNCDIPRILNYRLFMNPMLPLIGRRNAFAN